MEDFLRGALQSLRSPDEDTRLDGITAINELVNGCFGDDGRMFGEMMRAQGGVLLLSNCLTDSSPDVQAQGLLVLGNICSDSVDSESMRTKKALLAIGGDRPLLTCLDSREQDVLTLAVATLQNLCNGGCPWAGRLPFFALHAPAACISRAIASTDPPMSDPRRSRMVSRVDPEGGRAASGGDPEARSQMGG